jgi:hypothetical protein
MRKIMGVCRVLQMKTSKILFISLLVSLFSISTFAEQDETPSISPDRPGVGTPPSVIPVKTFQIESGFLFEKSGDGSDTNKSYSFEQTLLRYGLFSFAEVRLGTDFTKTTTESVVENSSITGFGPIQLGTKVAFLEEKGILPKTALLCNFTLPTFGKAEFRPAHVAPSIYLLMQNSISSTLSLGYNVGLEWDGEDSKPSKFYAVNLGLGLSDKLSCFVENYGYFNSGASDIYFDAGLAYLIKNNLQLDIYGGINAKGSTSYTQISIGIAYRFPK